MESAVLERGSRKYYTESEARIAAVLWEHLFAGNFSDLTVTQLCREAGVSRDTFYRHFSSTEQAFAMVILKYHRNFIHRNAGEPENYSEFLTNAIHEVNQNNLLLKYLKPLLTSGGINLWEQLIATMEEELLQMGYFAPVMSSAGYEEHEKHLLTRAYCTEFLSVMKYWTQHPEMTEASIHRMLLLLYNRLIQPEPA